MGKMLDAIASQLSIRSIVKEGEVNNLKERYFYKEVPEKTKTQFKKAFNQHMYRKLTKMKVGDSLDYMFDCGKARPLSVLMDEANENMAEVLQKLPQLPEGERYVFPPESYLSITLKAKMGKRMHIKINLASEVFVKAGL